MKLDRVYFDYNIYISLAKGELQLPKDYSRHARIYVSVAHAEEFFNAKEKNKSPENYEQLKKIFSLLTGELNNRGVLNPTSTKIINADENFSEALQRVCEHDTRQSIEESSTEIHKDQKKFFDSLSAQGHALNNENDLSEEDVWNKAAVLEEISKCPAAVEQRNRELLPTLLKDYTFEEALKIALSSQLEPFELKQNFFKGKYPQFNKVEFTIGFLQDVLNRCGYNRDKTAKLTNSGAYDTEHAIYATYCKYLVTNDFRLSKRLNAIYYYLGLKTRCLSFKQWYENMMTTNL